MNNSKDYKFLVQNISSLKGVGIKTKQLLKRKKIELKTRIEIVSAFQIILAKLLE